MSEAMYEKWEIPDSWSWSPLGGLMVKMKAGGTPSAKNASYYGGEIPFAKIEDITDAGRFLDQTSAFLTPAGLSVSSAWIVPAGAILYTMYGTYGVPTVNRIPVATNQAIIAMLPDESKVSREYLYWFLHHLRPYLSGKGTTQDNLGKKVIQVFPVPLPPRTEQDGLVAKIEEVLSDLDSAVRSIEDAARMAGYRLEPLRSGGVVGIKQSVLKEAFHGRLPL